MKKKISAHIAIILILVGGFLNVYIKASCLSCGRDQLSAFADDDTYSWESVSKDDLVTAFKYYCKSRNLAIEGSVADAITSFTTTTFNNLCNTLGIDSTALQAEIKKTTGGNLGLRFLFTQTGVNAYNRIFAEFLQNNDLAVGDTVDNEVIYSNKFISDDKGNSCYVFVLDNYQSTASGSSRLYKYTKSNIIKYGGAFLTYDYLMSFATGNFSYSGNINNLSYVFNFNRSTNTHYKLSLYGRSGSTFNNNSIGGFDNFIFSHSSYDSNTADVKAYLSFAYCENDSTLRLCTYDTLNWSSSYTSYYNLSSPLNLEVDNADITVTTNNNTINNNTYNYNYTIIYNDGDYYDYDDDDEPDPSTPPGGGGGGGGDDPDPDEPPIVDPTPTPDPTIPDWDIELPDMPVGNEWLLYGLEKKFPWDIPFNLMYMLSLFAADPETPHFQGTIDLKIVQWNYDIDLAPFDDIARNFRNFEFVGFIIGLMLLTRKLIWG